MMGYRQPLDEAWPSSSQPRIREHNPATKAALLSDFSPNEPELFALPATLRRRLKRVWGMRRCTRKMGGQRHGGRR
jgi:hypothetical protein